MLYIVATPIGNLEDISIRAINVLSNADLILAEDTRVTRVLLERYNINKQLVAYHQHSDEKKIIEIANWLKEGKKIALVSDAGTPGINDPGNYLISQLLGAVPDLKVVPIPKSRAHSRTERGYCRAFNLWLFHGPVCLSGFSAP
ncbi:MAG: S-adenosylmethionine-dependent methyltransferase, YraL family [Candidatus Yanofskybacteria bacterium GW2011_GWB1_45_11]|uniref:S-adenosylmethionine-dependent methyltransferase, YraL family n=1 Tax=Candidatus Yanofskybacteria bacterium GW2011_GWB1_45_11 TaxID=1619026 RepID=A0A0G1L1V5_9BACT|nr:MAG: S-adenosylmethionine-dependent methyltransferase, YraL family [Candidatus Yanofskybacteria bacterium GW2011_GWB1_45_11]